jgi:hypothetical protein
MAPNYYLYEKLAEARRQDLLREAEQMRLLAHLPKQRRNLGRNAAYRLGVLLVKLGMVLKESNQPGELASDQA